MLTDTYHGWIMKESIQILLRVFDGGESLAVTSFAVSWNRPPRAQQWQVQLKVADEADEHCYCSCEQ